MARGSPRTKAQARELKRRIETEVPVESVMPLGPGRVAKLGARRTSGAAQEPQTYSESARGVKITPERAAKEVRDHGLNPEDFFREVGKKKSYMAHKVLEWLGY